MSDYTLNVLNFEKQEKVFNDPARIITLAKGRRFGATRGAANNFIQEGLQGKFKKGLWVDTINANIDRYVTRYFIPHLKSLPENLWEWRKQDKILKIRDSYIDFRSVDKPENIEGFSYDKFFLNEAGIILKDEYLWRNAIRPMFWDYQARGVVAGTPKGGGGVFEELYNRGLDPDQTLYSSHKYTTFDNPYLNLEEIKKEMLDMPERVVKQEIFADFLEDSGVVFRGFKEIMTSKVEEPQKGHLYVIGVDLAKVQDFTVITVYDRINNHQVYQERIRTLEYPFQKAKITSIARSYNNALISIDATGLGDPIADDLIRVGLAVEPVHLTNEIKKEIIEKLVIWIEQKKFRMLDIPETEVELRSFTYDVSASGRIRYEAPSGFHDDIVIANALAVWKLQPLIKPEDIKEPTLIQQHFRRKLEQDRGEVEYEDY